MSQSPARFSSGTTAELGESPAVDEAAGLVWWVDIAGRRLCRSVIDSGETISWEMPEAPGFVVLDGAGCPVIGMETGLFGFAPQTGALKKLLDQTRSGHRFNDATVDPGGTLWVSTMPLDLTRGAGAIWRVDVGLTLTPIIDALTIPNGMAVDAARRRIYYSDSHPDVQRIWRAALDPESGMADQPVLFADMTAMAGRPDGAALDAVGRYWIAAVDGAALSVFSPEATHLFDVALPVMHPTKLAFHGARCDRIVVTSKRDGGQGGRLAFLTFDDDSVRGVPQARWNRP
ncbi:MAG: SMP-30/gluconolactonase/LRE family protein [Hoeflea sp.]|nr:SMP-30/gluconolactonase/LRE family protein [Hoeflea sp.]